MTVGIYILKFISTTQVYVGQSLNIEGRYRGHLSRMRLNKSAPKLQEAYNTYGTPTLEIILECTIDELDKSEQEAIEIYNSVSDGFNTLSIPGAPNLRGEVVGTARYSNDIYLRVLHLLISDNPKYTKREISEITGVSLSVVRHIASLESHTWLGEVDPEAYKKLVDQKNAGYYRGKDYPLIRGPGAIIYKVTHVTNFAKEHNLAQSKLSDVLNGRRDSHKGWYLVEPTIKR